MLLPAMALPANAADSHCIPQEPPSVTVKVETADIVYDFSKTARQLTMLKTDTASPYPPGADSVSGGLREDTPKITSNISWVVAHQPRRNLACLSYRAIDVTIRLSPKIFVAREFRHGACRDAILQHERKHVEVDRHVMNRAARAIGDALQADVSRVGYIGPFPAEEQEEKQKISAQAIEKTLNAQISLMEQDMRKAQQRVDTLEEYKRVSSFCRDVDFPQ